MKHAIKSSKENMREFEEGQAVAVRKYHGKDKWTSEKIIQREGTIKLQSRNNTRKYLETTRRPDKEM